MSKQGVPQWDGKYVTLLQHIQDCKVFLSNSGSLAAQGLRHMAAPHGSEVSTKPEQYRPTYSDIHDHSDVL